jgi:hypothetical protein
MSSSKIRALKLHRLAKAATAASVVVTIASFGTAAGEQRGGPQEGITVHGAWVIEVRNPDGTVATRREFENALVQGTQGGDAALAQILGRGHSVGHWVIEVTSPCEVGPNNNFNVVGTPLSCYVAEPGWTQSGLPGNGNYAEQWFENLTVGLSADKQSIVLSGRFNAERNTSVYEVGTYVEYCAGSVSPDSCAPVTPGGASFHKFTGVTLSDPVPVVTGQIVDVTVTISFS